MKKYMKKPLVIEALLWTGDNTPEMRNFFGKWKEYSFEPRQGYLRLHDHNSTVVASPGDWIIKGIAGEFYPCKAKIFTDTYEEVTGEKTLESEHSGSASQLDQKNVGSGGKGEWNDDQ